MEQLHAVPVSPQYDVRMDGVHFCRAGLDGPFARSLQAGNYSYCVMVRAGRLRLETDFPVSRVIELSAGDCVTVSGLAPHMFRSVLAPNDLELAVLETTPINGTHGGHEVELVLGVAPNESLALGSLMVGPIIVRAQEHHNLSRRLWAAVAMIEDEYGESSLIDRDLVIRRLAEIMLVNISRRILAVRLAQGQKGEVGPASRPVMLAIDALLRAPDHAWTLPELARAAGMSRSRFAEEFKMITGHTPARIVSRMRLTATARRLASEKLTVETAAEDAGYSSAPAFVRAFQREFGATPARWRRRRATTPPMGETPGRRSS